MALIKKIGKFLLVLFFLCLLFISIVGAALLEWYSATFGVTIREILYTIKSPLKGADTHFLESAVIYCMVPFVIFCIISLLIWGTIIFRNNKHKLDCIEGICYRGKNRVISCYLLIAILALNVLISADQKLMVLDFAKRAMGQSRIYEDYYVSPQPEFIVSKEKRNLIHIYLESMETAYASKQVGGYQDKYNYIPNLTDMAMNNVSFSNNESLGGFICTFGTGWTMGAIFATETGLPFCFPVEGNEDFGNREAFATGVISIGDILEKKGYYQEFLCGSDATFGGRKAFFEQHGNYDIFDWYKAVEKGYISEDEYVWWGLEDKNLYKIAKDELTRMANQEQPFNLTMLTVDTHHVDGWVCSLCGNEYSEQLANVVKCADDQIYNFITWCKEQPWYENTTIVIQGDHTRMDTSLVDGAKIRPVYNCFINVACSIDGINYKRRSFATMDMYPSILAALGYYIPENRMGLGTNMFSSQNTLMEDLGFEKFNVETGKYSSFYIDNFS